MSRMFAPSSATQSQLLATAGEQRNPCADALLYMRQRSAVLWCRGLRYGVILTRLLSSVAWMLTVAISWLQGHLLHSFLVGVSVSVFASQVPRAYVAAAAAALIVP
jgi:hypothetical protein